MGHLGGRRGTVSSAPCPGSPQFLGEVGLQPRRPPRGQSPMEGGTRERGQALVPQPYSQGGRVAHASTTLPPPRYSAVCPWEMPDSFPFSGQRHRVFSSSPEVTGARWPRSVPLGVGPRVAGFPAVGGPRTASAGDKQHGPGGPSGGGEGGSQAPGPPTSYLGGIRAPKPKAENLLSLEERRPHHTGSTVSLGVGGALGRHPPEPGQPGSTPPLPWVPGPALNPTEDTEAWGREEDTSLQAGTEPTPTPGPQPDPGKHGPPVFGTSALCHPPPYRGVYPSSASVSWSVKWATLHICVKDEGDHVREGQPHLSTWGTLTPPPPQGAGLPVGIGDRPGRDTGGWPVQQAPPPAAQTLQAVLGPVDTAMMPAPWAQD